MFIFRKKRRGKVRDPRNESSSAATSGTTRRGVSPPKYPDSAYGFPPEILKQWQDLKASRFQELKLEAFYRRFCEKYSPPTGAGESIYKGHPKDFLKRLETDIKNANYSISAALKKASKGQKISITAYNLNVLRCCELVAVRPPNSIVLQSTSVSLWLVKLTKSIIKYYHAEFHSIGEGRQDFSLLLVQERLLALCFRTCALLCDPNSFWMKDPAPEKTTQRPEVFHPLVENVTQVIASLTPTQKQFTVSRSELCLLHSAIMLCGTLSHGTPHMQEEFVKSGCHQMAMSLVKRKMICLEEKARRANDNRESMSNVLWPNWEAWEACEFLVPLEPSHVHLCSQMLCFHLLNVLSYDQPAVCQVLSRKGFGRALGKFLYWTARTFLPIDGRKKSPHSPRGEVFPKPTTRPYFIDANEDDGGSDSKDSRRPSQKGELEQKIEGKRTSMVSSESSSSLESGKKLRLGPMEKLFLDVYQSVQGISNQYGVRIDLAQLQVAPRVPRHICRPELHAVFSHLFCIAIIGVHSRHNVNNLGESEANSFHQQMLSALLSIFVEEKPKEGVSIPEQDESSCTALRFYTLALMEQAVKTRPRLYTVFQKRGISKVLLESLKYIPAAADDDSRWGSQSSTSSIIHKDGDEEEEGERTDSIKLNLQLQQQQQRQMDEPQQDARLLDFHRVQLVLELAVIGAKLGSQPFEMLELVRVIARHWGREPQKGEASTNTVIAAAGGAEAAPSSSSSSSEATLLQDPSSLPQSKESVSYRRPRLAHRSSGYERGKKRRRKAHVPQDMHPAELAATTAIILLKIISEEDAQSLLSTREHSSNLTQVLRMIFEIMERQKASTQSMMMSRSKLWVQRCIILQLFGVMVSLEPFRNCILLFFNECSMRSAIEPDNARTAGTKQSTNGIKMPGGRYNASNFLTRVLQEHNKPLREFALRLLIQIIRTNVDVEEAVEAKTLELVQSAKEALIVEFMMIFHTPMVQHAHDLSFITMLLGCVRKIIEGGTSGRGGKKGTNAKAFYQTMFRKKGCFVHIVNLFSHLMPYQSPSYANLRGKNYLNYQRRRYRNRRKSMVNAYSSVSPSSSLPESPVSPKTTRESKRRRPEEVSADNQTLEVTNQVLRTLILLMEDNTENQQYFRREIYGYKQLQRILIHFVDIKRAQQLYNTLFDFLVMDLFCPMHKATIKNPDILPVMFDMLPARSLPEQAEFLECFIDIVRDSTMNQEYCCRANLVDMLVDMLPYMSNMVTRVETNIYECRCHLKNKRDGSGSSSSSSGSGSRRSKDGNKDSKNSTAMPPPPPKKPSSLLRSSLPEKSETMQTRVIELIRLLGTHSITVPQLKKLFRVMKSVDTLTHKQQLQQLQQEVSSHPTTPTKASTAPTISDVASPRIKPASSLDMKTVDTLHVVATRPTYNPLILAAIERMFLKASPATPENFWLLEGGGTSGLVLPPIRKWPKNGFSLNFWLRCDKRSENGHQEPRLFSVRDKNGEGLEVFIKNRSLKIAIFYGKSEGKAPVVLPSEGENQRMRMLEPKLWYSVTLSFSRLRSGSMSYILNGDPYKCFWKVKYPQLAGETSKVFIGTDDKSRSFQGQLGPINIFKDIITEEEGRKLWKLGPEFTFSFQASDPNVISISKKVMRAYNAKASTKHGYADNAPLENQQSAEDTTATPLLPGTHACVTRHVKDVIHCLGGIQVLFPISEQLDQPVRKPRQELVVIRDGGMESISGGVVMEHESDTDSSDAEYRYLHVIHNVSYDPDPDFVCRILRLMRLMVVRDETNQVFMKRHKGFALLAFILEQLSPVNLTPKVALEIDHLITAINGKPDMVLSVFWNLMANLKLWMYAPEETQETWVTLLKEHGSIFTQDKDVFAVQRLIDQLRLACWYEPENGSQGVANVYHPITGECIGRRFSKREVIARVRGVLLVFIESRLLQRTIYLQDIRSILVSIEHSRDTEHRKELLSLFVKIADLRPKKIVQLCRELEKQLRLSVRDADDDTTKHFLDAREPSDDSVLITGMLLNILQQHSNATVRSLSLRAIFSLYQAGLEVDVERLALYVRHTFTSLRWPLSLDIYSTLLSFMLNVKLSRPLPHPTNAQAGGSAFSTATATAVAGGGGVAVEGEECKEGGQQLPESADGGQTYSVDSNQTQKEQRHVAKPSVVEMAVVNQHRLELDGSQTIQNPCFLRTILQLAMGSHADMIQCVVQELTIILKNEENKDVVLQEFGWQSWLFDIIVPKQVHRLPQRQRSKTKGQSKKGKGHTIRFGHQRVVAIQVPDADEPGSKIIEDGKEGRGTVQNNNNSSSNNNRDGEGKPLKAGDHTRKERRSSRNSDGSGGGRGRVKSSDARSSSHYTVFSQTGSLSVVPAYAFRILHMLLLHGLRNDPQGSNYWQTAMGWLTLLFDTSTATTAAAAASPLSRSSSTKAEPPTSPPSSAVSQASSIDQDNDPFTLPFSAAARDEQEKRQAQDDRSSEHSNSSNRNDGNGDRCCLGVLPLMTRMLQHIGNLLDRETEVLLQLGDATEREKLRAMLFLSTNAMNVAIQAERCILFQLNCICEEVGNGGGGGTDTDAKGDAFPPHEEQGKQPWERKVDSIWECLKAVIRTEACAWKIQGSHDHRKNSSISNKRWTNSLLSGASLTGSIQSLDGGEEKEAADAKRSSEKDLLPLTRFLEAVLRIALCTEKNPVVHAKLFGSELCSEFCKLLNNYIITQNGVGDGSAGDGEDRSGKGLQRNSEEKAGLGAATAAAAAGGGGGGGAAGKGRSEGSDKTVQALVWIITKLLRLQDTAATANRSGDQDADEAKSNTSKRTNAAISAAGDDDDDDDDGGGGGANMKLGGQHCRGYVLKLILQLLRCGSAWPRGIQKCIPQLANDPSSRKGGGGGGGEREVAAAHLQWEHECSDVILRNSTWVHYLNMLAREKDVVDCIKVARENGKRMILTNDKMIHILHDKAKGFEEKDISRCNLMRDLLAIAFSARALIETKRRHHLETRETVTKRIRFRTLQHILRNLSNERGPWCPYNDTDCEHGKAATAKIKKRTRSPNKRKRRRLFKIVKRPRVYWKMDKSEIPGRVRNKLKVNWNGASHAGCKVRTQAEKQQQQMHDDDGKGIVEEEETAVITKAIKVSLPLLAKDGNVVSRNSSKSNIAAKPEHKLELGDLVKETEELLGDEFKGGYNDGKLGGGGEDSSSNSSAAASSGAYSAKLRVACSMMTPAYRTPGFFIVTREHVHFEVDENKAKRKDGSSSSKDKWHKSKKQRKWQSSVPQGYDRKWEVSTIRAIMFRRKKLRQTGLEIFFENNTNCFFDFESQKVRRVVYRIVCSVLPDPDSSSSIAAGAYSDIKDSPYYFMYKKPVRVMENPVSLMEKSGLTKLWQERKISNFEYLMMLNTIAGRTYNDLSQYPVMPWILKDYTSKKVNLNDPSIFRDLSKPIGAQSRERLEKHFLPRYREWDHEMMKMPPFMYGTHYSSAGYVLFYMIRIEPFTTEHIRLQSGYFDNPNRMFHSVPLAWQGCQTDFGDVKELIPEWYYQPEMFRNMNGFDMGTRESGETIGDVKLPPWAETPEDFTRISREALESEYVSSNLHRWIDLIFGDKQQGKKAEDACNVFCHYTYENAIDIDAIKDEMKRNSVLAQIEQFGQCPSQIFSKPHPKRFPRESIDISVFSKLTSIKSYVRKENVASAPIVRICVRGECVVVLGADRSVGIHKWRNATADFIPPFSFELEKKSKSKHRRIGVEFARGMMEELDMRLFAVSHDGKTIFSCGHWDNSFKLSSAETGKLIQSIVAHKDVVTCLALSRNSRVLVTGSKDTTVMVWLRDPVHNVLASVHPQHILYGHDDEITCVAVDVDIDVVISGSRDGTCIVYSLRSGNYTRSIYPRGRTVPIKWLGVSPMGTIITYSGDNLVLRAYSMNGRRLHSTDAKMHLNSFYFSESGEMVVVAGRKGTKGVLMALSCHSLRVRCREETPRPIRSIALSKNEHHLLVAMDDASVMVYALNESIMRRLTLQKLKMLGF